MSRAARGPLPLFPLDNVVLFPQIEISLYIFEPRYRQMTAAVLASDGRIGMTVVVPARATETPSPVDMTGDPVLFPIGCEGEIRQSKTQEDGTYRIVLQGTRRFRIRHEIPRERDRLYRIADVEPLEDGHPVESWQSVTRQREEVLRLMRQIAPDRAEQFSTSMFENIDDATFVNAFCRSMDFPVLEKQQLLEANSVRERIERLALLMQFQLAEHSAAEQGSSGTVH